MAFNAISGPKMIVQDETIAEMLAKQMDNNNGLFAIDCTTGEQYGYAKLKKDVLAVATAFQKRYDFGRGDVIMITGFGSYEGQVIMLAGLFVGATVASFDYNLKRETLALLISESKPDVIFCSEPASVAVISDALKTVAHRPALTISTTSRDDGFTTAYSSLVQTDRVRARPVKSAVNNNHPCVIIFSSGTTGVPKGIYLSDYALKSTLTSIKSMMDEPIENKCMTTSPMFWYSGVVLLMFGVYFGKPRLFFSAQPSTEQTLSSIQRFKPTFLLTGVAVANEMTYCQMTNGHRYNIDSLLTFAVGGSPMRPELQKTITENLLRGRIPVKQVYGSSEQGVVANWTTKSDINTVVDGCVGKPAAGIEIRIVGLETGECVNSPNTEGEIRIKSPSNMIGYMNDMKKTVISYDEDGWFKSGDIGYYTDDCYLFIVGRIKELMIYKGKRIAPTDVETVLLSHSAVLDAGVTSRECLYGDLLIGIVKVKPGVNVEADRLVSYVKNNVKDHEQLRGGVIFVDDVPRSPAGKLKRDELKRLVK